MSCSTIGPDKIKDSDEQLPAEKDFIQALYQFMKDRHTPIERIPNLGFKQIDLFLLYKTVHGLGGYDQVTINQQWRQVYNEIGGNPRSTSAATCTRKHYEKMILPYERHLKGEDDHPELLSKAVKRCSRGLFKDQISERHGKEGKKPRLGKNSKKNFQNKSYVVPHERVTGLVPNNRDQRLWKQEYQQVLAFSRLAPLLPTLPAVQTKQLSSPQHARYNLVNQQTRTGAGPPVPQESKQHPQDHPGQLAKGKSTGEEEEFPLNLSSKRQPSELLHKLDFKLDSSSSPKCTVPKFLNQVSPLYSTHLVKRVENQVISSGNCTRGNLLLPDRGNHTQHINQFLMNLKGKDISEAGRQTSLSLNSSHNSKKIPHGERSRSCSTPGDNSCCRFISRPQSQHEVTSPSSVSKDLYTFLQSSPHCAATQLLDRVVKHKTEHSYKKTTSSGLSEEPPDLSLHSYTEQNRVKCSEGKKAKTSKQELQFIPATHIKVRSNPVIALARLPNFEKLALHKGPGGPASRMGGLQMHNLGSSFPSVAYASYPDDMSCRIHKTINSSGKPEQYNYLEYPPFTVQPVIETYL